MNDLTIVMYHYVRNIKNSQYKNIKGLETDGFKRQLDYLSDNFNIIKAEMLIDFVKNDIQLPKNSCLLTFDDGYKDHLTFVLPELLKRKLQGSFFPPVKPVLEREILDVHMTGSRRRLLCITHSGACVIVFVDHTSRLLWYA